MRSVRQSQFKKIRPATLTGANKVCLIVILGSILSGLTGQLFAQPSPHAQVNHPAGHFAPHSAADAASHLATTRLLGLMLNAHIPKILHQEKNIPWMGGKRSLSITKAGTAVLKSTARIIKIQVPLHVALSGNINTDLVVMQVQATCSAAFNAPAVIDLVIDFSQSPLQVKAKVDVDVPPVMADCEGYKLSVQELIRVVIEQQKIQWQKNIQQQINDALKEMNL